MNKTPEEDPLIAPPSLADLRKPASWQVLPPDIVAGLCRWAGLPVRGNSVAWGEDFEKLDQALEAIPLPELHALLVEEWNEAAVRLAAVGSLYDPEGNDHDDGASRCREGTDHA